MTWPPVHVYWDACWLILQGVILRQFLTPHQLLSFRWVIVGIYYSTHKLVDLANIELNCWIRTGEGTCGHEISSPKCWSVLCPSAPIFRALGLNFDFEKDTFWNLPLERKTKLCKCVEIVKHNTENHKRKLFHFRQKLEIEHSILSFGLEFLITSMIKIPAFWDVTPCFIWSRLLNDAVSIVMIYYVDDRMINEGGAVGGMKIEAEIRRTRTKSSPAPPCSPETPFDRTWDRFGLLRSDADV